jgi:hypothetical protein
MKYCKINEITVIMKKIGMKLAKENEQALMQ